MIYVACFVLLVVLALRRLFAPRVTVARVNGVWLATVTGIWSRREYVRVPGYRISSWPPCECVNNWSDMGTGAVLGDSLSLRADRLIVVHDSTEKLREVPA